MRVVGLFPVIYTYTIVVRVIVAWNEAEPIGEGDGFDWVNNMLYTFLRFY